jgi:two-component system chemotaxis response regulator CheY
MRAKLKRSEMEPLSVLVVEDNEHMRILLRTLLNAFGIKYVLESTEGGAGLKQLAARKPDFILTDFSMAPMDGVDFTKAIRQLPDDSAAGLPIIMVTGHTEKRRVEAARDAGVNGILAKPVTAAGLFQRIEEIVHRPRAFVRSPSYSGPCRRRHNDPSYAGPWRRASDEDKGRETVRLDVPAEDGRAESANR